MDEATTVDTKTHLNFTHSLYKTFNMSRNEESHRFNSSREETEEEDEPDRVIGVQKSLPCKWNGRRTLATGFKPAFYACFVDRVEVYSSNNNKSSTTCEQLRVYLQALGEYNLANPAESLFCLVNTTRQETWASLAQAERRSPSHRFVRGVWSPQSWSLGDSAYSPCYHDGYLALPAPWGQQTGSSYPVGHCYQLCMAYGAEAPYQTDFAPMILLEMSVNHRGLIEVSDPPRTRAPLASPKEAWTTVLPSDVLKRLLTAVVRPNEITQPAAGIR